MPPCLHVLVRNKSKINYFLPTPFSFKKKKKQKKKKRKKSFIFLSPVSTSCYKSVNLSILLSKQTLSVKTLFWAAPRAHTSCSPVRNIHSNGGTRLGVLQGEVASARLGWQEEVGLLGWAGAKSTFHPSWECPASLWYCQPPLMSMSVQWEACLAHGSHHAGRVGVAKGETGGGVDRRGRG